MKKSNLIIIAVAGATIFTVVGTAANVNAAAKTRTYTIGVASDFEKQEWSQVAKDVKSKGIVLKVKEFTDYTEENPATKDGSLDLNGFQTKVYLDNWNKTNKGDLVNIGWTYISPLGLYSKTLKSVKDIKSGDKIAIPNDVTNGGRAINLLASADLITLNDKAPKIPAVKDIKDKNGLTIETLDPSQIAAALPDVTAAVINTNYVQTQLKETPKDAIYVDTDHAKTLGDQFKNAVVVKKSQKNNKDFKTLVKAYQTDKVKKIIEKGGDQSAWDLKN
ncbi:MetQ/NlpA family ABC transporter substrate-binding protein [Lactovum miscens]|uniref:D-methionine transport system substrate-binding protein n=1 Tax=Lactovum miscens TaxID=190387 RepID=A0A841C660_9LACT|nr:MetQ/NlpA family ABC transporter substrate-binding protein [Lactovum miscens]MBB5887238.1 D-methionine transport system substrate-binding protein [Lactovum miscens]